MSSSIKTNREMGWLFFFFFKACSRAPAVTRGGNTGNAEGRGELPGRDLRTSDSTQRMREGLANGVPPVLSRSQEEKENIWAQAGRWAKF